MTDTRRPMTSAQTEVRRSIYADDTEIPVISTTGFTPVADKQIGDEFVRCASFGVDQFGWPVMRECRRGVAQEDGGSEPRPWPGGTPIYEVGWTMVDIVDELPEPTPEMVGRQFNFRDDDGDVYTFNVVTSPEGTPVIDWINEPPGEGDGVQLGLGSAIAGLTLITGVAVDASGNVYVVGHGALFGAVKKYNPSLVQQWSFNVNLPSHVATDGTKVYWTDSDDHDLNVALCSDGSSQPGWGSLGTGNGQFDGPHGVCTDGVHVWVVDRGNNRVQKFTVAGVFVSQFGSLGAGDGQFDAPTGIAIDGSGNLYVADSDNDRIQKFNSSHAFQMAFGVAGNADGQFQAPDGIAVGGDGRIWVSDQGNHRVQVFDSAGVFLAKVGAFGSGTNQLKSPWQIALDGDDIGYVADNGNDRLSSVRVVPPGITPVITTRSVTSASIPANNSATITANCLADEIVIGGGFNNNGAVIGDAYQNRKSGNGWVLSWRNTAGAATTVTVEAYCMQVPLVEG